MDFYKIKNKEETVSLKWSHNYFEDYKFMAHSFFECGYHIFSDIVNDSVNNIKWDMWFFTAIFLVRQGIELGLKSLICKSYDTKEIQGVFIECKHDILKSYSKVKKYVCLKTEEKEWLEEYLVSIESIDEKSDMFRFPFDDRFLSKYRNKFLDIIAIANNLLQAFSLIEKCMYDGKKVCEVNFNPKFKPEFFVFAENGIGNCYLWEPNSDYRFYTKINGYSETIGFLYNDKTLSKEEKFFPLMFMGRNTVELSLKRLFFNRIRGIPTNIVNSKRRSHLLRNDLWKHAKQLILNYSSDDEKEDVEVVDKLINEIDELDKRGDNFRYPTNYSLGYRLEDREFDLENIYSCIRALINFFEGCDCMLDAIAEQQAESYLY